MVFLELRRDSRVMLKGRILWTKDPSLGFLFVEVDTELGKDVCRPKDESIGKDSDAGRDWGQEEKGTTEDEMAGWHHQLDGYEFE